MLSQQTIGVIKQTIPVLAEHGETLTRHFYRRMFEANPEVRAFFNPAHQHTGGQQRALAAAICAYATHIETPQVLAGAIELIAQKHASLGVLPEHYPVVGMHLLASIREVLGDAASEEIINAWAAAYGVLADILIKREAAIYQEHRNGHGWSGFEPFIVRQKVRESDVITSFHLVPKSGAPVRAFKAGQYITVRMPAAEGGTTMRNYSLSNRPGSDHYRISVKRESGAPAGHVSNHLHDHINIGGTIEVGPPCGEFTLKNDNDARRPLVLISGGVGITPLLSMLHEACARDGRRDILFIHGALNGTTHAFRREVLQLAESHSNVRVHFRYSDPTSDDREQELADSNGFINAALLDSLLESADADFYFCGPKPFLSATHEALSNLGVRPTDMHYEFFGPLQEIKQPAKALV